LSHLDLRGMSLAIQLSRRKTPAHFEQAKQVLLAAGAGELLMRIPVDPDYREAIWDQAAGTLLVQEAGGRVTDLDGLPLDFTTGRHLLRNTGLIASNRVLHDAVLEVARWRGNAAKGSRGQP
jgi:3'(2'), 5'-bisphosphate nucleotidase